MWMPAVNWAPKATSWKCQENIQERALRVSECPFEELPLGFSFKGWVRVSRAKVLPTEDSQVRRVLIGTCKEERSWEHFGEDVHGTKIKKDLDARERVGIWSHRTPVKMLSKRTDTQLSSRFSHHPDPQTPQTKNKASSP